MAFVLSTDRWDEIVEFCETTGVKLVFGLNGDSRTPYRDFNASLNFNLNNTEAFVKYVASCENENEERSDDLLHARSEATIIVATPRRFAPRWSLSDDCCSYALSLRSSLGSSLPSLSALLSLL